MDTSKPLAVSDRAAKLFQALARGQQLEPDPADWLELVRIGLVSGTPDEPKLSDPSYVLRRVEHRLHQRTVELEEQLVDARDTLEPLLMAYSQGREETIQDHSIRTLSGFAEINLAINDSLLEADSEVITAQPGGGRSANTLEDSLLREAELLRNGIRIRTLYQHTARFSPATRHYALRMVDLGSEVRTLDEFFDRLIIVDAKVAFIPCGDERSTALAVHHPGIVRFLVDVFDRAWTRAVPFSARESRDLSRQTVDSTRMTVARLLIEGETDDVSARRAGLSLRNYREHVKNLMTRTGAQSRAQLGYQLARSGFFEESPDAPDEEATSA